MRTYLVGYGATSAAGEGVLPLWNTLIDGKDHRDPESGSCRWNRRESTSLDTLVSHLEIAWREATRGHSTVPDGKDWGVIFASTKGRIEDIVWGDREALDVDPLTPVLTAFLKRVALKPARHLCVSNACASAHSAIFLANHWLTAGLTKHVLILSADEVGKFVMQGFRALGALSSTRVRPFSGERDGLQLGEAATALILSSQIPSDLEIEGISVEMEGSSVTRPTSSGKCLVAACRKALRTPEVDVVVAHGTGTRANDDAEDKVFREIFVETRPLITGTKWALGHTLGSSGAVDLIAAAQILKTQQAFPLANTPHVDATFDGNYAVPGSPLVGVFRRALVTSLGFGGIYAACVLRRVE